MSTNNGVMASNGSHLRCVVDINGAADFIAEEIRENKRHPKSAEERLKNVGRRLLEMLPDSATPPWLNYYQREFEE